MMNKLLIISGPTATGKTELGVYLAKKFNGEIVSADSRQVYKGMDIITGKDLPANSNLKCQNSKLNIESEKLTVGFREKEGIPIWLVDIVDPDYPFNVREYQFLAHKVIADIWRRKKLPIVVGGSGLYIKAIIRSLDNLNIPPDNKLRKELEGKKIEFLQQELTREDPDRWERMNQSERGNPRRLIRAIEIGKWKKKNITKMLDVTTFKPDSILMIGLRAPLEEFLAQRINKRVEKRLEEGVVEEVRSLIKKKYSWFLASMTAVGCQELKMYFEGKETLKEISSRWKIYEYDYARRQIVWFKKEKDIIWFDISKEDYLEKIEEKVKRWYTT